MPVEPTLLKRSLFAVPIEKVDDPALYQIFREKQDELDRQITLLLDMNTPRFVHGSIQLFGGVDDELDRVARDMLEQMPPTIREKSDGPSLDAQVFAERAEVEIESLRRQWPEVKAGVQVREDIHTGLMVSKGSLLIGADTTIPAARAEALMRQHEVGTHVLTYWNGRAQPFPATLFGTGRIRSAPGRDCRVGGGIRRWPEPVASATAPGPRRCRPSHDRRSHLRRHVS